MFGSVPHPSPVRFSPLPPRDGIDASWIRFPDDAPWLTVGEAICAKYPSHWQRFARRLQTGAVVDSTGTPVHADTPLHRGLTLFYYRDVPPEVPVPFAIEVLYRDDNIVVADKPHFLATMPRGRHVTETATVRLRRILGLPELTPAHRLDRLTAGILLCTTRAEIRSEYQDLFARREVNKHYLALAPYRADLSLPATRSSRIVKKPHARQATEEQGPVNAVTHISLDSHDGKHAVYRLQPVTGRTHQLRVHMSALGVPIDGDPLYPRIRDDAETDFSHPLRLLAHTLSFTDPISRETRTFVSRQRLPLSGARPAEQADQPPNR